MKKRLRKLLEEIKIEMLKYNGKLIGDTERGEKIHFEYMIKKIEEELGES